MPFQHRTKAKPVDVIPRVAVDQVLSVHVRQNVLRFLNIHAPRQPRPVPVPMDYPRIPPLFAISKRAELPT